MIKMYGYKHVQIPIGIKQLTIIKLDNNYTKKYNLIYKVVQVKGNKKGSYLGAQSASIRP